MPPPPLVVLILPPNCSQCLGDHPLPANWQEVCKENWLTPGCASCYAGNLRAPTVLQVKGCRLKGKNRDDCNVDADCLSGDCALTDGSKTYFTCNGSAKTTEGQRRYVAEQSRFTPQFRQNSSMPSHYGKTECAHDEFNLGPVLTKRFEQLEGTICGAGCSDTECPSDVPPGTTAKPMCAFLDLSAGGRYCGLKCTSAEQCPDGAMCSGLPELGVCVYSSAPPTTTTTTIAMNLENGSFTFPTWAIYLVSAVAVVVAVAVAVSRKRKSAQAAAALETNLVSDAQLELPQ